MAVSTKVATIGAEMSAPGPSQLVSKNAKYGRRRVIGVPKPPHGPETLPPGREFWEWLSEFGNDDWQNLVAYLWRMTPITDRRMMGKPSHIRKYVNPFDQERIMLDEGSGGYRIDLVKIDPAGTAHRRIAQHSFSILNMDYPPRVPAGEWLNDPDNEMWKWAEPALKAREIAAAAEPAPAAAAGYNPSEMFNTVLNGMRTLRGEHSDNGTLAGQVLEMVQSNQEKMMELSNPTTQLTTLKNLLAAVTPPPSNESSLIVTILRDELKATRDEVREMRTAQAAATKPISLIDELIDKAPKLKQAAEMLGFTGKARGGGNGIDWGEIAIRAIDKFGDLIPAITDGIRARYNPAAPAATTPGFSIAQRDTAQPMPSDGTTATPPAAPVTGTDPNEQARLTAVLNKYGPLIQGVSPFLIDQYQGGMTGYDFRDWFISRHGQLNYSALRGEVGAQDLTALAQSHPVLKAALAPPENLLVFLTEFFTEPGKEPEGVVQPEAEQQPAEV